ncbi:uncharacterized protein VTP21DRAFT_7324 [Calcarisporiella thermophila]|uniref:uncharacterized protein n=1 Tax=Calcarisporiella thermophila TaxID=911321 RepID=UPI0037446EBF
MPGLSQSSVAKNSAGIHSISAVGGTEQAKQAVGERRRRSLGRFKQGRRPCDPRRKHADQRALEPSPPLGLFATVSSISSKR